MTDFWQFMFQIIFKGKTTIAFIKSNLLVMVFLLREIGNFHL